MDCLFILSSIVLFSSLMRVDIHIYSILVEQISLQLYYYYFDKIGRTRLLYMT